MNKTKLTITIILILIAGFLLINHFLSGKNEDYILYTVTKGKFIKSVKAKGTIEAKQSRLIKAPSILHGNTRIIKIVDEGEYVEPGDFLIQFDESKFKEELEQTTNNYKNAVADLESKKANIKKEMADLESQLKIEKYNLEQMELRAKNSIYEAENKQKEIEYSLKKSRISYNQLLDKIESTRDINQKELKKARLKVEQAKLELDRLDSEIDKLRITSPGEGLVVYKTIWGPGGREKLKVGATPWRGMTLMEIPDQDKRKVQITVNESDISQIQKGQRVEIKVEAIRDTIYHGKVTKISSLARRDRDTEKKVFDIEVEMDQYDERLKPGMSTRCEIIIQEIDKAIYIPLDGIAQENKEQGVYKSSGKFQNIETGITNSDFVLIKSGLKEGQQIRIQKKSQLKDTEEKQNNSPNNQSNNRRGRGFRN